MENNMNKYETIFLMRADISEEERQATIKRIKEFLYENGKVTNEEDMGLKTLAYEIKTHKQAYYFLMEFESEYSVVQELERIYRITDEILKFIVVKQK